MQWFSIYWTAVPIVAFVALAISHDRTIRGLKRARLAIAHYERCIARVQDKWSGTGRSGEDLQPAEHPYAADLDLFGKGSLFELLCTARTRAGEQVLANWLTAPAN
ncbi:MAG: DNA mismatch repair protein MutS, partial [Candidatus Hydrogenedentes bacterium]|nr:DNA mismatch repair protein MutS [Candidatus Hydrogenedentota bacterium]